MADYSTLVIDHFDRPRNVGRLPSGNDVIEAAGGGIEQGASFHLSARVVGDTVKSVRFAAYGCPHCIAAASWVSEHLPGRTFVELAQWSWREAAQALDVPTEKRGRLLFLEDVVRRLAEIGAQRS